MNDITWIDDDAALTRLGGIRWVVGPYRKMGRAVRRRRMIPAESTKAASNAKQRAARRRKA